ncbi:FKBP-type peptidyl-prolyl cis-trans isomerase [Alteromonas sp. ASW11-36]|uniref:Peptidyl-prolyl cis-trans isomerase n=1 Tax=Alteromonas arenosi TaxID=3055817 RepID=A0ABT7T1D5_9ALTE|nr:FKBP-type peptidyl-prolyl cis-trans isomerase [Alteromonas sp. ASW11-36]MDM7862253.1 FKBP-type peptidyl-prolyl cis-trans isomerase [Alteromonas sp. ASW11-36]
MRFSPIATVLLALGLAACQPQTSDSATTDIGSATSEATTSTIETATVAADISEEQKHAYVVGASMGTYIANRAAEAEQLGVAFSPEDALQGFKDAINDNAAFTLDEMSQIAQAGDALFEQKKQEPGQLFLVENAKREGVVVTDSGLQYEVLTEGTGAQPTAADTVTVHYRGTFIDGSEFDSSYSRGEPISFPLNGVIRGWTEGLQLMKVGSKHRLYIPYDLAYGPRGRPGSIPPYSTLIFDVELVDIAGNE